MISFAMPLRNAEEPVAGSLDEAKTHPRYLVRNTIHEVGRIEKYSRNVFLYLRRKDVEQRLPGFGVVCGAQGFECLVCRGVGVECDIEAGVVALTRVPKGK